MGDSITAAFSAHDTDLVNGFIEYRSDSWSIGADPSATTLFNFFKTFNTNVQGGSTGNSLPIDVYRMQKNDFPQVDPKTSLLNAAVSEAKLDDIGDQIAYLKNMTNMFYANISSSWKFINILIGANDICPSCNPNRNASVPSVWLANLDSYINQLYQVCASSYEMTSSEFRVFVCDFLFIGFPKELCCNQLHSEHFGRLGSNGQLSRQRTQGLLLCMRFFCVCFVCFSFLFFSYALLTFLFSLFIICIPISLFGVIFSVLFVVLFCFCFFSLCVS